MYVGRLVEYKRVDDLLGAIKIIKGHIPDIQCKVIGSGPQENKLKALAEEFGIADCVEFFWICSGSKRRYRADETLACFLSAVRG